MLQYFAEKISFVLDYKEKYESISTVFLVCLFYCGQSKYNDCKVFLVRPAAACGRGAGARPRHHEVRGQPDPNAGYGVVARVVRGDIECTNGYIHLVDSVIMRVSSTLAMSAQLTVSPPQDQDVRLESATAGPGQRSPYLALLVVLVLYLIKTVPFIKLVI